MAATLSSSLIFPTALPKPKSGQISPLLFFNHSHQSLRFYSTSSNYNRIVRLSRRRNGAVISAISGSPGIESYVESGNGADDILESVKVFDLNGNGIPIYDLWKDRKAVVAFARHFGCVFCRKRADYLASKKDTFDASGVALVLIGPGNIDQAKAFKEQTNFQGEVYADPAHSSYEALNFVSGVLTTFTPKAGLKIIQLYMEGYRQDWNLSFQKDTVAKGGWQQGGIIVAGPGKNNILYIHKVRRLSIYVPIFDLLCYFENPDTSKLPDQIKKQGMIQTSKIFLKLVAHEEEGCCRYSI